jgi:hypothetical protein
MSAAASAQGEAHALSADLRDQNLGRAAHVQGEQLTRAVGVARDYRFHYLAQFADEVALARHGRRRSSVIAKFLDLQHLPHSSEPQTVAARYQVVEKRMVQSHEAAVETTLCSRLQRRRARQLMESGNDSRFPPYVARRDGVSQAEFFDFDSRGRQVPQIFRRNGGDAKATLRPRLHQTFRGESRQRFADGPLTGFEPFAQFADTQRLAGFKTTVEQVIPQLIVGALGEARPSPCGTQRFDTCTQYLAPLTSHLRAVSKVYIETKNIHEYFGSMGTECMRPLSRRLP